MSAAYILALSRRTRGRSKIKFVNKTERKSSELGPAPRDGGCCEVLCSVCIRWSEGYFLLALERKLTLGLLEILQDLLKVIGVGNRSPG